MARVTFSEIERWETLQGVKRAETARRLNVTSQTLNGWRLRGRVSADESDRVRTIISDSAKPESTRSVLGSPSEPELPDTLSIVARESIQLILNAVAKADGALDKTLAWYAQWISRIKDPKHVPKWTTTETRSKRQLRIVFNGLLAGISDHQAEALAITLSSVMPPISELPANTKIDSSAWLKHAVAYANANGIAKSEKLAEAQAGELVDRAIRAGVTDLSGFRRYLEEGQGDVNAKRERAKSR